MDPTDEAGASRPPSRRVDPTVLLLFLAALATSLPFAAARGLWDTTEGRYAECAREMLDSGDYLVPRLEGRPHLTKPPLYYWSLTLSMATFGRTTWAVRLPNCLFFALTTLLVMRIGELLADRRTGVVAGLIHATAPFPMVGAHAVSTDTLLALCETAAIAVYLEATRPDRPEAGARVLQAAVWICLALGFLAKGPVVLVVLPVIVLGLGGREPDRRTGVLRAAALAAGLAVALPWFLLVAWRLPGTLEYWLGEEVVARVLTDRFGRNPEWYKPAVVYLPGLTLGMGPWILGLLRGSSPVPRVPGRLLWLWLGVPLVVFSLSKSRLWLYVLPLTGPVSVLLACRWKRVGTGVLAAVALLSAGVGLGMEAAALGSRQGRSRDMRRLAERVRGLGGEASGEVAIVGSRRLHGLDFYLDRIAPRLAVGAPEPDLPETLATWSSRVCPGPGQRILVLPEELGLDPARVLPPGVAVIAEDRDGTATVARLGCDAGVARDPG